MSFFYQSTESLDVMLAYDNGVLQIIWVIQPLGHGQVHHGVEHIYRGRETVKGIHVMRKPKVKESTYIKYDTALRKHIKPKLGGCFPMGMTTGLIDDFTEELLFEDELAPKTVHDVLVVLHGILKYTATFFTGGFPAIEINV